MPPEAAETSAAATETPVADGDAAVTAPAGAGVAGGGTGDGATGAAEAAKPAASTLLEAADLPAAKASEAEGAADDGFQPPDWSKVVSHLSKKDKALGDRAKRYGSLEDVLQNELKLRKEVSKAREGYVKPPGEGATEDDVKAWRKVLGVPESAAAYGIAPAETAPPEAAEELGAFLDLAHRNNLPAEAVKTLVEFDRIRSEAAANRRNAQLTAACDEAAGKLQGEWMGDFKRNSELANRAFDYLGGPEAKELMDVEVGGRKLGAHPVMLKMLHKAGEMLQSEIPHLAASRTSIAGEWQQMQAEQSKVWGTPAYDAAFQKRYAEAFERAHGAGLA